VSFKKRTKSDTFRANLYVEGRLSISGKKFLYIESADAAAYLPQIAMIDDRLSKEILAQQGVIMPSPAWRELQELAFCISQFEPDLIADRPGWNGDAFVFTENDVIAADEKEIKVVAVDIDPRRSAKSGTLDGWLDEVAEPLSGQSLPMFLIMAVLTAPLLQLIQRRENPAFETSGRPGCGKSTLLIIISSVSGEASVEMFNVTLDGLESSMCASSGQPLILDEANLFYGDESSTKRVAKWKALPFRLANGQDKKRYGVEQGDRSYFTTLIATNEPMTKLIAGENPAVIAAAADRLLALVIAEDRPYQTFDFVPKGYESAGSFAKALERGASANHGHAMARFVRGLVDELAKDRQALVDRINADIGLWKRRVGVTDDDGSISRTGDTFGLCYAAGEEAL
jgi:putative DNA primase/helicase